MRSPTSPMNYHYGKTFHRNIMDNIKLNAVAGAYSLYILKKKHLENAPVWSTFSSYLRPAWDETVVTRDEEGDIIDTEVIHHDKSIVDVGSRVQSIGAVDIADWIHSRINDHQPGCKVSFICTLVKESGLITNDDLNILIDYKLNDVKMTENGMKIVIEYHKLGAVLERRMQSDLEKQWVYKHIYDTWLKDILEIVKTRPDNHYEIASEKYNECLDWLKERYGYGSRK